tara:strand:- start:403 stop:2208 length:1806 start_codon:yes stop_codon:yes gene_type:complete
MTKIIGIDLGTTNSCMSVFLNGRSEIIPNAEGGRVTPSVVSFQEDGEILVGDQAVAAMTIAAERTIANAKRHMGTSKKFSIDGKDLTPQEISAKVLMKLKADASTYLGGEVKKAVVTVPAYFNDSQRKATKQAAEIAGLEVERIINEPTAAALAYGLDKEDIDETIAVFDFGGGTFDVTVLEISDGVFEVKATNGHTKLGGADIDDLVADWIADKFYAEHKIDLRKDKTAWARVLEAAEKSKKDLSSVPSSQINLPYLHEGLHLKATLTRSEFEKISDVVMKRLVKPCENAMKDAGVSSSDIDKVILVGGSTRIPKVQDLCKKIFGKSPERSVNPDEVVASGAAIQGNVLDPDSTDEKNILLIDVTPLSLGIETLGGVMTPMIKRNSPVPTEHKEIFSTAADNQPEVEIHVLQGERKMANDNVTLGRFKLVGILPAKRGIPQIEVAFKIDANGLLNVEATDKKTGKSQKIQITGSTSLTEDDVQQKIEDAEKYAEEDKAKKESVEIHNNLDSVIWQTESMLEENKEKATEDVVQELEKAIESAKSALGLEDIDTKKTAIEDLQKAAMAFAQTIQPEPGGSEDVSGEQASDQENEEVIEGEE